MLNKEEVLRLEPSTHKKTQMIPTSQQQQKQIQQQMVFRFFAIIHLKLQNINSPHKKKTTMHNNNQHQGFKKWSITANDKTVLEDADTDTLIHEK